MKEFFKNRTLFIILIVAIFVRVFYLVYTPPQLRVHDFEAHMQYVRYVATYLTLPDPAACFECYHPPLYYLLAAPLYVVGGVFALQFFSLALSVLFLILALKTVVFSLHNKTVQLIAFSLLAFWPAGIMYSARIGNDALFYVWYALGFYFLVKWYTTGSFTDFCLASGVTLCALLTKSNGLILLGTLFVAFFFKIILQRKIMSTHIAAMAGLCLLSIFILTFRSTPEEVTTATQNPQTLLVANVGGLPENIKLANTIKNYALFDAYTFITVPFLNQVDDASGRQFYWNYLLKSSLFGEFQFSRGEFLATLIAICFLLFSGSIFLVFVFSGKLQMPTAFILHTAVGLGILASITLRVLIPYSPSADFRYIFPVIIPGSILVAQGIEQIRKKEYIRIYAVTLSIMILFLGLSTLFFLYVPTI